MKLTPRRLFWMAIYPFALVYRRFTIRGLKYAHMGFGAWGLGRCSPFEEYKRYGQPIEHMPETVILSASRHSVRREGPFRYRFVNEWGDSFGIYWSDCIWNIDRAIYGDVRASNVRDAINLVHAVHGQFAVDINADRSHDASTL